MSEKLSHLAFLDRLRALAVEGINYVQNPYDRQRYMELLDLAAADYADVCGEEPAFWREALAKEAGSITPKVGADAGVIDEEGRILILRRAGEKTWCLPCGWVEVQESPAQAACRETLEETGLHVEPWGYIRLPFKAPSAKAILFHQINPLVLMKPVKAGSSILLSHEHDSFRWISSFDPSFSWHDGHEGQIRAIFDFLASDRRALLAV